MLINRKIIITLGLFAVVSLVALTSMTSKNPEYKNLKVLPKNVTHAQLGNLMGEWSRSLGVHCSFCHVRDEAAKKMDFASDAKPEKEAARHMFKMMNKINQKYFEAKKDSLGMVMRSGINCYTCHRGTSHPEVTVPEGEKRGPGGPPPGAGGPDGEKKQ
ncbi:MAG: c-type cytochrome [Mucilaginibacter sp.]|jgi:hypothetical protein|nr:c-type cytochrome [Mucilaginibacter sp.]